MNNDISFCDGGAFDVPVVEWDPVPCVEVPTPRSLHVAAVVATHMYLFGGYDGSNRVSDFYRFDFESCSWSIIHSEGARPCARDRHSATVYESRIYIFGGYDGSHRRNDLWCYDTVLEEWREEVTASVPTPRHSHASATARDKIYIFAGYDGNFRNDTHCFDIRAGKWERLACKVSQMPKPRYRTSMVIWRDKAFVFGGHDGLIQLKDLHQLDLENNVWSLVTVDSGPITPQPRDSHVGVTIGDNLYILGGSSGRARNDLYAFNMAKKCWHEILPETGDSLGFRTTDLSSTGVGLAIEHCQELDDRTPSRGPEPDWTLTDERINSIVDPTLPRPRFCHTGVVYKNAVYMFGGYDGGHRMTDFVRLKIEIGEVSAPPSTLSLDLKNLVNNKECSDVSFLVDGQVFHAHKVLLLRNEFFRAMLTQRTKESVQTDAIRVDNIDATTFLAVLTYLYTDDVLSLRSDLQNGSIEDQGVSLLVAADRFGVERLKWFCERKVLSTIDCHNVSAILLAADRHNSVKLRSRCISHIIRNFDTVIVTRTFEEMAHINLDLVFEIFRKRASLINIPIFGGESFGLGK
eukprot:GHVN01001390.1.p1 GENE.GHVN01001390.1~~GHVN01001390.1.p1  ORF type:complete len:576 (+),score=44.88 GHVN01001390.1:1076-2803(+)